MRRLLALAICLCASAASAATFTVTNNAPSDSGSLRQAILAANATPGPDEIVFAIPGAGVHTIALASPLPAITDPVIIDGYTQPGSSPNTKPVGEGLNTVLMIEIDGTGAGFRLRGAVYSPSDIVLGGATEFPPLMALGATGSTELAYKMGKVTALEARAVGIHVPFAPVLDVNSNPDNPIINVRSLGEDPERVAELGAALVRGIQDHGAVATAKHFPGHGDTQTDSHLELPVIEGDVVTSAASAQVAAGSTSGPRHRATSRPPSCSIALPSSASGRPS